MVSTFYLLQEKSYNPKLTTSPKTTPVYFWQLKFSLCHPAQAKVFVHFLSFLHPPQNPVMQMQIRIWRIRFIFIAFLL